MRTGLSINWLAADSNEGRRKPGHLEKLFDRAFFPLSRRWCAVSVDVYQLVPLNMLIAGQRAQVGEILGRPDQVQRLKELGLHGGSEIEMVQTGSPCIIRLGGHKLCFRADELTSILVLPGECS